MANNKRKKTKRKRSYGGLNTPNRPNNITGKKRILSPLLRSQSLPNIQKTEHSPKKHRIESTQIIFPEESDMKLILLNVFAHDPVHDFLKIQKNIFAEFREKMANIHHTMQRGGNPQEIQKYIQDEFIPELTHIVFGSAIAESIRLSSMKSVDANICI